MDEVLGATGKVVLAPRHGDDEWTGARDRRLGVVLRSAQQEVGPEHPAGGLGRTGRGGLWRDAAGDGACALDKAGGVRLRRGRPPASPNQRETTIVCRDGRPPCRSRRAIVVAGPAHGRLREELAGPPALRRWCGAGPGCCWIRTSPAPSCAGSSTTDGHRERAEAGELAFGTVDSWMAWRLQRRSPARDRRDQRLTIPLLYDIHKGAWATSSWRCSGCARRAAA